MTIHRETLDPERERSASLTTWAAANKYVGPESFDAEGFKRFRVTNPVDRMGLYLFECANGDIYIGIAKDAAQRLRTHRNKHPDAVKFWFRADPRSDGERRIVERQLVRDAQRFGLVVRNREHASGHTGVSTLDALITPNEQESWLENPVVANAGDKTDLVDLGASKLAAHAGDFAKLSKHPRYEEIIHILGDYAAQCIPLARRTEATFWTVSCYPSWNRQRVFCVSMAGQEVFFIVSSDWNSKLRAMLFVDGRELHQGVIGRLRMLAQKTFPKRGGHKSGGAFEQALYFRDIRDLKKALKSPYLRRSIAKFNLDLMRKRQSAYKISHCRQLAEAALTSSRTSSAHGC